MRHFLQLDRTTLPVGAPLRADAGLLQLFYCTDETSTCPASEGAFEPFSQGSVVRIIDAPATTVPAAPPIGAEEPYPLHPIVGWERFDDYPATAEHELLGLKYDYDFSSGFGSSTVTVEWAERGVVFGPAPSNGLAEAIAIAESGDKLAGWPAWVQGVEYPSCPRCGATMRHVFQVDSEDHVPYMFGGMGCAHITQCPAHRDVVAFGWACG